MSDPQKCRWSFVFQLYWFPKKYQVLQIPQDFNGTFKTWHFNGLLMEEVFVLKGMKKGFRRGYYSDGTVKMIENYDKEGRRDGEFKYYYSNGKLAEIVNYEHGVLNGERIFFGKIPPIFLRNDWGDFLNIANYFLYENGKLKLSKKIEYSNDIGMKDYENEKLDYLDYLYQNEAVLKSLRRKKD